MRIAKYIFLQFLLLIIMSLASTAVMKFFDLLFELEYKNIWTIGFKVGFIAWLGLLATTFMTKRKNAKSVD